MWEERLTTDLVIAKGTCFPVFAYEVAQAIDLDAAERRLLAGAERQTIKHKRRAPAYFEYEPAPLRVAREAEEHVLGSYRTSPGVELVLYDFGAVSVSYAIPLAGSLASAAGLASELWGNERLLADSRGHVERLLQDLGDAAVRPRIAEIPSTSNIRPLAKMPSTRSVSPMAERSNRSADQANAPSAI